MSELKVNPGPKVNTFDFDFFATPKRHRGAEVNVSILICKSYVRLSRPAYHKLRGPEYFKVGIDVQNRVICVTPALGTERGAVRPTAKQIQQNTIFITKSKSVIKKLMELGIPQEVQGKLVDGELLFKF